jgi:hypothetical protein
LIGLDPALVDYRKLPGWHADRLRATAKVSREELTARGFNVELCYVDRGETAAMVVARARSGHPCDCVLIGAGVRTDPERFLLFERLINVVHQQALEARICFNTNPTDTTAAVLRWA